MATKITNTDQQTLTIEPLKKGRLTLRIIGTTPLYFNSMSAKSQRQLLVPEKKTKADKAATFKHEPLEEFRNSIYPIASDATFLGMLGSAVKGSMVTAAMVTGGINGTDVKRMVIVPNELISVWGVPFLKMDIVRSADMAKTPDVRTRAFLPRWCVQVDIEFLKPMFNPQAIVTLLANAGVVAGLGDFRQEKGKGNFGSFEIVTTPEQELEFDRLVREEGRSVQEAAMKEGKPYDQISRDLFAYSAARMEKRRQLAEAAVDPVKGLNGAVAKRSKRSVADAIESRHDA